MTYPDPRPDRGGRFKPVRRRAGHPARSVCPMDGPVLSAYADGELDPSVDEATRAHLYVCRECRDTVVIYLSLRARLRRIFG